MSRPRGEIAIIGAGPIGLEAALAASEAGVPFTLYEAGSTAGASILEWGHVRLFTPWALNLSERARRRLLDMGLGPEDPDHCPTGSDFVRDGLRPLAEAEDISPNLRLGVRVVQVGREARMKNDEIGTPARADTPFRLLLRDAAGNESVAHADTVLDCTGSWTVPNALGSGGVPAPGESAAAPFISHRIPDLRDQGVAAALSGKRLLLVGAGHSAQTAARDLAVLKERAPETELIWLMRSDRPDFEAQPDDPLQSRADLLAAAGALATGPDTPFDVRTGKAVQRITNSSSGLRVTIDGDETLDVDHVFALTGSVGDRSLYTQLQVHECWATQGPMRLAAALLSSSSADCLTQESHGADTLRNPEPDFFILGSKSYGRNTTFLLRVGYEQVDQVFSLITSRTPAASGAA